MNLIVLEGRLTKDFELVKNQDNMYKCAIAVNNKDKVSFFNFSCFMNSSKMLSYLTKGQRVIIQGQITNTKEDDKVYWNIWVDKINLLTFNKNENQTKNNNESEDIFWGE